MRDTPAQDLSRLPDYALAERRFHAALAAAGYPDFERDVARIVVRGLLRPVVGQLGADSPEWEIIQHWFVELEQCGRDHHRTARRLQEHLHAVADEPGDDGAASGPC